MPEKNGGGSEWIQSVLARFEGPLLRYAVRITGDLEKARDVVQETFLRLCRENATRQWDHLEPWLFTVCRNCALDAHRKEGRMTALNEAELELLPNPAPNPVAILEKDESVHQMLQLLAGLPPNQQEVIRLKFQNSLSYQEISQITGLSVSNVGFLLHMGIRGLRQQMDTLVQATGKGLRRVK